MRGRKPKPTSLRLVENNPGRRPINEREPVPPQEMPSPPAHLSDAAKVEWGRVAEQLYLMGVLSVVDRAALAAYCQAYARWVQAESAITEMAKHDQLTGGLMIKTSNGNAIQNPLVGTANKAAADMVKYAAEFGMTPSARSRLEVDGGKKKEPERGAKKYF